MTGLIQDYTPYVSFYKDYEDINEDALNSLTIDGKLYGMPTSIDVPMLGFSVKVLRQIAVDKYTDKDYPDATERNALRAQFVQDMTDEIMAIKTWEDYKEVAKQLTTTTISGAGVWVSSYHLGFGVWHAANGRKFPVLSLLVRELVLGQRLFQQRYYHHSLPAGAYLFGEWG